MKCVTPQAVALMHRGTLALSKVESAGIRVDTDYLDRTINEVAAQIQEVTNDLMRDPLWARWRRRFGRKASIGSIQQLGTILFTDMGYTSKGRTATGKVKMDEAALEGVDLLFVKSYLRLRKLNKVKSTYLEGIRRETCEGRLHPSFNLHLMLTYRSSSDSPNFQNMPIRNKEMGKLIRQCFIASPGCRLLEIDFSQIEVRVAACYNKDPKLLGYINDPTTDMHHDTAMKLFMLRSEQVVKKETRDVSKNMFVFPQFYGSYYADCARAIWNAIKRREFKLPNGTPLLEHLASKGITKRGRCDGGRPEPGTFEKLVKDTEDWFWHDQYTVYTRWKKRLYEEYLKTGEVSLLTGFVCRGIYRRNQVINFPVQGAAFHCLLWSIIMLQEWLEQRGFKAKIVGQIHDCLLIDCPESELQDVLTAARQIMTVELPKAWPWIIVPLETESDVTPPGGNWHQKELWTCENGRWSSRSVAPKVPDEEKGPNSVRVSPQLHKGRK